MKILQTILKEIGRLMYYILFVTERKDLLVEEKNVVGYVIGSGKTLSTEL